MSNTFAGLLKTTLCGKSTPVFFWREQGQIVAVSAANLWTLALRRRHVLRKKGLIPGAIWCSSALDFDLIIDLVACAISGNPFFPSATLIKSTEINGRVMNDDQHLRNQNSAAAVPDSSTVSGAPCLILKYPGTDTLTTLTTEILLTQLYSTLDTLRPSDDEIRLSCLKPYDPAVLLNDVLCGMLARQTIYVDFQGEAFQHPEFLLKIAREESISTFAVNESVFHRLGMTPIDIKRQFNIKTVYSVETLEIY